ncbi:hypothetical protein [Tenuifilum sp.]|uniref:hypothetical protein n=1 Tax=Tenuifilum sp. TaxID=2760880 RepID=UPI00258F8790|nr:hypothetical protein [Tenuifilum sp.]
MITYRHYLPVCILQNIMYLLHLILLSFLWQSPISVNTPKELILRVFDEATTEPISDCFVLLNGAVVGQTDANGLFKPTKKLYHSKVLLKHMSYIDKEIDLSMLPQDIISIPLKSKQFSIEGVTIKSPKRIKFEKMGIYKKKPRKDYYNSIYGKLGLYIPNKKPNEQFVINQLCIYIVNKGNPASPFLFSLYAGEKEFLKPNDSLRLLGPILFEANKGYKGDDYLKINLYEYKLPMPSNGLFVVLELPVNYKPNYQTKKFGTLILRDDINSIKIGDAWEETNKFYAWFYDKNGWRRDTIYWENYPKNHAVHHGNPMIYVTLKKR